MNKSLAIAIILVTIAIGSSLGWAYLNNPDSEEGYKKYDDGEITDIEMPDVVYPGDTIQLEVTVRGESEGYHEVEITAMMKTEGKLKVGAGDYSAVNATAGTDHPDVAEKEVHLSPDEPKKVTFVFEAEELEAQEEPYVSDFTGSGEFFIFFRTPIPKGPQDFRSRIEKREINFTFSAGD